MSDEGGLTIEMLTDTMDAIRNATYELPRILVHPREYAWIKDPVGPAPTLNAVQVALAVGAVTMEHPEVQRLMSIVRPAAKEGR